LVFLPAGHPAGGHRGAHDGDDLFPIGGQDAMAGGASGRQGQSQTRAYEEHLDRKSSHVIILSIGCGVFKRFET
jgi:hypothetical protein